jgi:hypothetical protein
MLERPAVDCVQLAAAVAPASLLAGMNVVSFFNGGSVHAAASCVHHSGSKLPSVHGPAGIIDTKGGALPS